jgi:CRP-like cAMP-binding protein
MIGSVNPLIAKLDQACSLTGAARLRLEAATAHPSSLPAHHDFIRQGEICADLHVVMEGFACRYRIMHGGRRSILGWLMPGDMLDLHLIPHAADCAAATVGPCMVARISRHVLDELIASDQNLAEAIAWARLGEEAILRQWLANMGQGPASRQFAHLVCETFTRLRMVRRVNGPSFAFPFTQEELGDTLGLSSVHVNRVLQQLREEGLVTLYGRMLTIRDLARLERYAEFDPAYLQLASERRLIMDERKEAG